MHRQRFSSTLVAGLFSVCGAALAFSATNPTDGSAAPPAFLSAKDSDPRVMGWMQGFPPPADRLITQPDSNFFSFPRLRWSVCHLREFLPTKQISRGLGAPTTLPYALDERIDAIEFQPVNSDEPMTWEASLYANYTDGMLILHHGRIVYERYFGCLEEDRKHAIMSMTKSITGLLAEILVAEGVLDDGLRVIDIIPETQGSAFATATVRQVMDMTTGVKYSENYSDPNADIWLYSRAASPLPRRPDYEGPDGYWEYLQQVEPEGEHGAAFHYKTINSDMLGWIISRVAGQSVTELASKRLWRRMGAEQDAYQTIDGKGVPFAGGGISAGLRDLGRLGLLMLNEGVINGRRLFPASVVKHIRAGGDPAKFQGFPTIENGSYTSQWWVFHNAHGAYAARGVHGQTLYIDPTADMVLVRFASYPRAQNGFIDPTSLPAYQAVAEHLLRKAPGQTTARDTMTQGEELIGEWQVTHLAGTAVLKETAPKLRFADDGAFAGSGSCNRFSGGYTINAAKLALGDGNGNLALTRMLCPPPVMAQEDRFLALLPTIDGYELTSAGDLILKAAGDEVLRAARRRP